MCHIPVFCWITAKVLETVMIKEKNTDLPKNLTELYLRFLRLNIEKKSYLMDDGGATRDHPSLEKMIESLGKLAFEQLKKNQTIFKHHDIEECNINIENTSLYLGVFNQIFKKDKCEMFVNKEYSFMHLTFQEFLAALYAHLTFVNSGVNLLEEQQTWFSLLRRRDTFYQTAVEKALKSQNGQLDMFLRFLLGLSLETNQNHLQDLLTKTGRILESKQKTVQYIKKKINGNLPAEQSINLFHCLNELNDHYLQTEIQQSLRSGRLSTEHLSPAQWSALVFILMSSEEDLKEFDLQKYSSSEEALLKLLPVIKASKKALLRYCNLSKRSCEVLSSILSSPACQLKVLDLSGNDLQDSGVRLLSEGLQSPDCKLETLSAVSSALHCLRHSQSTLPVGALSLMYSCFLDFSSWIVVSLLISPQPPSLRLANSLANSFRVLDLGWNPPCMVRSFRVLTSVVHISFFGHLIPSHRLSSFLTFNNLTLTYSSFSLEYCRLTEMSGDHLSTALKSNPSHLTELNLNNNNLQDSGVRNLCAFLENPECRLKTLSPLFFFPHPNNPKGTLSEHSGTLIDSSKLVLSLLRLCDCRLSKTSCEVLAAALRSNPSNLKELDLGWNGFNVPDVKQLSDLRKSPDCSLKTLRSVENGKDVM
uniref:NACHT LRR and PYD domain-containing protein n=1 Tax=Oryzias sinensis TaxID=183150 RepID=A0A8C7ZPC5_9TELE